MRVMVVGASGTIGSKIASVLERDGREVVRVSRDSGVNVISGDGLEEAFKGVDIVVDVTNTGSFGEGDALKFFRQAGKNLLVGAKANGVSHYLALSVVGADRLVENDYFRAKLVQENLVRSSGLAHTIVRSTQFFEFISGIVNASANDGTIRLPSLRLQPIAADEAANLITNLAVEPARNSIVELGGPTSGEFIELARELLTATEDNRPVATDPNASYFGVSLAPESLLPARVTASGKLTFRDWLFRTVYA